jgi:sugar lactone lactonase YvrE
MSRCLGLGLVAAALLAPPSADAAPACQNPPQLTTLYSGYGTLESVIVDPQGRLYFTDQDNNRVMRADTPGATPVPFATGIPSPGGLAFLPDGDLLVGTGDAASTGLFGPISPSAGIVRVNTGTGAESGYASGLQMANGVAVGPSGEVYGSDDLVAQNGIDRVGPGGSPVETGWANVASANGLVVDSAGQYLYAAQTFQPPMIARIKLSDPALVSTFVQGSAQTDLTAGLDGMTRDEADQLYVAANGGGQIWKVTNPGRQICSLASVPPLGPSSVYFGQGSTGFSSDNLYAVTFNGTVLQLSGARKAEPASSGNPPATGQGTKCRRHKRKHAREAKRRHCKRKHRHKRHRAS